jgi:hypothetical protein
MITITKKDMERIIYTAPITAHYGMVFKEISEVYDENKDYTLDDMLLPFAGKKYTGKPYGYLDPKTIRYSNYIIPLFYAAYVCKEEKSGDVMSEIIGLILSDQGHFQIPDKRRKELIEMYGNSYLDHHWYWIKTDLNDKEEQRVKKLYAEYLSKK